jgi:putative hemolysin
VEVFFEVGVILVLLVANGVFAMAEIAVVSSRKGKLKARAEAGSRKAAKALALAESPNRFLATVQVGITLVGIVAGAYGGASLSARLEVYFKPMLGTYAHAVAFTLVVICITYLSLIVGELLPKRVGLSNPEGIASVLAGPMSALALAAKPLVTFLSVSTEGLMRLLGFKDAPEATVTEEELKLLAREGLRVGVLHRTESEMVESVLALDKLQVRDLMTPRVKVIWIREDEAHERIWHKVVVSGHTNFPVYSSSRDRALGVISVKAIYANLAAGIPVRVKDLIVPPLVVPESQNGLSLLETFKKTGQHMAVVVDEFGTVNGVVTLHDLMEAIVGEFPSMENRLKPTAKQREDGSWLVDAMMPIEEFVEAVNEFPINRSGVEQYETFGGFLIHQLGHVPSEGESFKVGPFVVEIMDMDGHRIDKVLLLRDKKT